MRLSAGGGERIDVAMDRLGTAHPGLWTETLYPVGKGRDEAEILQHVLLADQTHRHHTAGRDGNRLTVEPLQHENSLCMVPEHSMAEIGRDQFRRLIKKLMQSDVLVCRPAPFARRRERVVIAMSHDSPLKTYDGSKRTPSTARCNRA